MAKNVFGSSQSPDLLSPNLRVKAQKRRRTRLGTGDTELDRSTQELLSALRDPVISQGSILKPLPAISVVEKSHANGLLDDQPLDDLTADAMNQTKHEKAGQQPRVSRRKKLHDLERCPTFTKSPPTEKRPSKVDNSLKSEAQERTKVRQRKNTDDASIFSDMSDELGFERRTRRRNTRRSLNNPQHLISDIDGAPKPVDLLLDSSEQAPGISKTSPRRRLTRRGRNSPAVVSPIEKLTLRDRCSPNVHGRQRTLAFDTARNCADNKTRGEPSKENKSKNDALASKPSKFVDNQELTKSNLHTHDTEYDLARMRKPRRRQNRLHNAESALEKLTDRAASDVMSTVSGDAYDPTFTGATRPEVNSRLLGALRNSHLEKIRGSQQQHEETSGDDVSVDIFTSPKRHKKRSRRRHQMQGENLNMAQRTQQTSDPLASSLYSTTALGEDKTSSEQVFGNIGNDLNGKSTFNGTHNASPRRRAYNKYLPPLSESFNNLK